MKDIIQKFKREDFYETSIKFFENLNIPLNKSITQEIDLRDIFGNLKALEIVKKAYMIGLVDRDIFRNINTQINLKSGKYSDGILILELN
jgi:hypothetical protein